MLVASCGLLWVTPAFADDEKPEPKEAEDKAEKAEPKEAEPKEGGKFSLLGRECKSEHEPLETTPGSPPLDVDDPATPGCNGWEINIVTSAELGKGMTGETPLFDINYGIGDNVQLKFEVPYELARVDGVSSSGFGRAELGLKYRFYDNESRGTSIAIYPQFEFAMPRTAAAAEGGTMTKLPLLFSTRLGETSKGDIMITANLGYNISTEVMTEHYVSASLGVGFPIMKKVAMMVEGSTEQALSKNLDNVREHVFKANVGFIGGITDHLMWFGALGQSFASSDADDPNHTCLLFGLRVLAGGP